MRLSLCIATATPKLFVSSVKLALDNATGPVDVFGFLNGGSVQQLHDEMWRPCRPMVRPSTILALEQVDSNIGVPAALHKLYEAAFRHCSKGASPIPEDDSPFPTAVIGSDHIIAYIHDDLEIHEKGWDQQVIAAFERDPKIGLVGFGGATALGGSEIYKKPYEIHQLGRRDFYSNMNGAEVHGHRTTEERPIVFTDGMSMIVRRSLLDTIGGWSWWPFELVHHAYDYGIACMARRHGYKAWLVPCAIHHIGGQTAMMPVHQDMAQKYGGDGAVHAAAHKFVYDTFRDVYPLRLP